MTESNVVLSLLVAIAAGLLIGFEREQSAPGDDSPARSGFMGGARSHPLVALLGAVGMLLYREVGVVGLLLPLVSVAALVTVSYADDVRRGVGRGITSEVAFLVSAGLGALALSTRVFESERTKAVTVLALAVLATLFLSVKPRLHAFVRIVSRDDAFATVKFLLVAVVLVPLLPDRAMGPLEAINPRTTGLLVVLIAGISFVGYVAIRLLGTHRGLGLTGLVGGLASSTAVTLSMSGRARREPELEWSCALAIVLASSIMALRVLLAVGIVHPPLVRALLWPMSMMLLTGLVASGWFFMRSRAGRRGEAEVAFSNPFELATAVKFALVFAGVLLASKAATTYFGDVGTYLTGLLAGTTDVDAITLSMARLARGGLSPEVAVTTILIGVGSNTVVKGGMAFVLGGRSFGLKVMAAFGAMALAGAGGLVAVWAG